MLGLVHGHPTTHFVLLISVWTLLPGVRELVVFHTWSGVELQCDLYLHSSRRVLSLVPRWTGCQSGAAGWGGTWPTGCGRGTERQRFTVVPNLIGSSLGSQE